MKLIKTAIILLIFTLLVACSDKNKIVYSSDNHLSYLGLNGKVREVNLSIYEYEITDNGYVAKGKTQNNYILIRETSDLDLIFNVKTKAYNLETIFFDPYNIALYEIFRVRSWIRGTDFKMSINEKGFVTKFECFDNDTLTLSNKFYYDRYNRLIRFEKNADFPHRKVYFTSNYFYNEDNLIKSKTVFYKGKLEQKYEYKYKKMDDTIIVTEILSGQKNKQNVYEIDLGKNKQILSIKNEANKNIIEFDDFKIISYKEFFKDGKMSNDNEFHYLDNKIERMSFTTRLRDSDKYNHSDYKFKYNENGNINAIEFNKKMSKIVFKYEYNNLNWKKMSYSRNRKDYDYYSSKKREIEEQIKLGKYNSSISKLLDLYVDLSLIKKMSSKIVVERRLKYY